MKTRIFLAAIALAAVASCTKEASLDVKPVESDLVPMAFSASGEAVTTKTTMNSSYQTVWDGTETIKVFAEGSTSGNDFTVTSREADNTVAKFNGATNPAGTYYAAYPASAVSAFDGNGTFTLTIPQEQAVSTAGSFASGSSVAVAKTNTDLFKFQNVGALLGVTINGPVTSLKVEGAGNEPLSGTVSATVSADGVSTNVTAANTSVSITGSPIAAGTYWLVVLPGTYSGFKVTLTYQSGATVSLTNPQPLTIARNQYALIGEFDSLIPEERWYKSYVLNGKDEIEAFVAARSGKKETVRNLTVIGHPVGSETIDVGQGVLQNLLGNGIDKILGNLVIDSVGYADENSGWFDMNGAGLNLGSRLQGGLTLKNITGLAINFNAFGSFSRINGDLVFDNVSTNAWTWDLSSSLGYVSSVSGNLVFRNIAQEFNANVMTGLNTVGGDIIFENVTNLKNLNIIKNVTSVGGKVQVSSPNAEFYKIDRDGFQNTYAVSTHASIEVDGKVINGVLPNGLTGNSYTLTSLEMVELFKTFHTSTKEVVDNLTISGNFAVETGTWSGNWSGIDTYDARIGKITGTLTLEGISISGINIISYIPVHSFVLKDIPSTFTQYGFQDFQGRTSYMTEFPGDLTIINCPGMHTDWTDDGIAKIKKIAGNLHIENSGAGAFQFKALTEVGGNVTIKNGLHSDKFPELTTIGGNLRIEETTKKASFNKLTDIQGDLIVADVTNPSDEFCAENWFPAIKNVGGDMTFTNISNFQDFRGTTLRTIGGNLTIDSDRFYFGQGWKGFYGFHLLTHLGGNVYVKTKQWPVFDSDPGTNNHVGGCIFKWYKDHGVLGAESTVKILNGDNWDLCDIDNTDKTGCDPATWAN